MRITEKLEAQEHHKGAKNWAGHYLATCIELFQATRSDVSTQIRSRKGGQLYEIRLKAGLNQM